jgi:hypothetical protein
LRNLIGEIGTAVRNLYHLYYDITF